MYGTQNTFLKEKKKRTKNKYFFDYLAHLSNLDKFIFTTRQELTSTLKKKISGLDSWFMHRMIYHDYLICQIV